MTRHHRPTSLRSQSVSPTSGVAASSLSSSRSVLCLSPLACSLVVGVAAALLFLNTLDAGFAYDDRLNYYLHQLQPMGYHLANVILHAVTSAVFTRLAAQVFHDETRPTLVAGLLFASHPVHCEAVASVVGRADAGAGLFFLLSLLCYTRFCDARRRETSDSSSWHLYLSLLFAGLAMLTKETGITVLAVCGIYHLLIHHKLLPTSRESVHALLCEKRFASLREGFFHLTGGGILLLSLRLYLMGLKVPDFAEADNPAASAASLLTRTLTFLFLPAFNCGLLVWPRYLSFDWSMQAIPLVTSLLDPRNLLSFAFYATLVSLIRTSMSRLASSPPRVSTVTCHNNNHLTSRPREWLKSGAVLAEETEEERRTVPETQLVMAVTLMVLPWLPASNLFFYVGFVVAERVLYIPSMGFCLLIASGMEALMKRKTGRSIKAGSLIALSILLMSSVARTWVRNIDWRSEENLYRSGLLINPPKAYGNLGNVLSSQARKTEAEDCYRAALAFRPNMADVHYNLGILLQEQGRLEQALQSYQNAIRFRPRLAVAHLNMALTLTHLGRKEQAIDVYRRCASLDGTGLKDPKNHESTRVSALFNLGRLLADEGRLEEAITAYRQAIDTMPTHYQSHSLFNVMGEAYFKMGQFAEAESWYRKALSVKADHVPAHLTLAKLYAKANRSSDAEQVFLGVQALAPNDSSVYQHYGQFLADKERFREAAAVFVKGAAVAPRDFDMVFGAANMLRQAGLNEEAEKYYKLAVRLKPHEGTSHMNLGAMLHVNGKLREAESEYLHALRLRPNDLVTQNNLAKLRLLMQRRMQREDQSTLLVS